jgi:hypothetical protein
MASLALEFFPDSGGDLNEVVVVYSSSRNRHHASGLQIIAGKMER